MQPGVVASQQERLFLLNKALQDKRLNCTPHPHALSTQHFARACLFMASRVHNAQHFSFAICNSCFILHDWSTHWRKKHNHIHHDTIVKVIIPISVRQKATGCLVVWPVSPRCTAYEPNMTLDLPVPGRTPPNITSRRTSSCSQATSVDNAPTVTLSTNAADVWLHHCPDKNKKQVMLVQASITL